MNRLYASCVHYFRLSGPDLLRAVQGNTMVVPKKDIKSTLTILKPQTET